MIIEPSYQKELLIRTAGGDEQAFAKLFHSYRNKIYTVAFKLTESEESSEEIVQDVFLKVWLKKEHLSTVEDFDSWLFIIARNTAYSFLRKVAVHYLNPDTMADELADVTNTDTGIIEKEYRAILKEAVDKLPAQQQQVYRLSKEEGLKQEEIAEQMNIAPETVKKHLQYAMRSIRAYCIARMDLGVLLLFLWKIS